MFAGPRHSGVLWYTMLQKEHSSAVSVLEHCWQSPFHPLPSGHSEAKVEPEEAAGAACA